MEKTVYVIGHKNPDTDSVVSAAAYAELKRRMGMENVRAARAGAVNPQTEYIFDRFGVELPEFIPDLMPKVEYYYTRDKMTVGETTPLWEALGLMGDTDRKILPITDGEGRYKSMLHYGAFAQNILAKVNPQKKAVIPTSVGHLIQTIKAQAVVTFDENVFFKARMVVGALSTESFQRYMNADPADNKVVLVGDREEAQRIAIEAGVRVLIVTNGAIPSRELRELAEQKRVSILVSPYDTSSTVLLTIYSTPVWTMGDETIKPVSRFDLIKRARKAITDSPSRSVPVIDEDGMVVGILTEGDLIREANIELIMVDHNEFSQAIDGIEHYRVLEVIDHHRLGSFSTSYPITFINRVVGSTSTIVASMFRETRTPLPKPLASILLCGILSDTIVLQSATATDIDRDIADYLASITDLDILQLGTDIMASASEAASRPAAEIVGMDMKEYTALDKRISVSQVEVAGTAGIMARREEILASLAGQRMAKSYYLSALMVTDINELSSLLFIEADREFLPYVSYPRLEPGVYVLKDVLSRKKQLMPALLEMIDRADKG
ncbi:MAG: putative manganese-dependent inorganic diphosphatase [Rectinemataceae bacterium]|nr:putative manganese-dependent inorganic diphosphatase [Rectinemataceae bacterium]